MKPDIKRTVENLRMPIVSCSFRSGFAYAKVDGVLQKLHTSQHAETSYELHRQDVESDFESGKGAVVDTDNWRAEMGFLPPKRM